MENIKNLKERFESLKKEEEKLKNEVALCEANLKVYEEQLKEKEQELKTKFAVETIEEAKTLLDVKSKELEEILANAEKVLNSGSSGDTNVVTNI